MTRPRLLDLFCGGGGAAVGYHRAGFEVVGVDINPQPHYPFEFHQDDALSILSGTGPFTVGTGGFHAVHASPPCQKFSITANLARAQGKKASEVDLLTPARGLIQATGLPYVIENVEGAPMQDPILLCGSMFGLEDEGRQLRRHRLFESNLWLSPPGYCGHQGKPLGVYHRPNDRIPAGGETARDLAQGQRLMGIDWMTWDELKEAIPPAYTEFLGRWLRIFAIERAAA